MHLQNKQESAQVVLQFYVTEYDLSQYNALQWTLLERYCKAFYIQYLITFWIIKTVSASLLQHFNTFLPSLSQYWLLFYYEFCHILFLLADSPLISVFINGNPLRFSVSHVNLSHSLWHLIGATEVEQPFSIYGYARHTWTSDTKFAGKKNNKTKQQKNITTGLKRIIGFE